jgi:predicted metalloprotease with PDZ domain
MRKQLNQSGLPGFSATIAVIAAALFLNTSPAHAQPTLDRVEERIRSDGAPPAGAEPGYLGLVADDRKEQGRGIRILDVTSDGPAAKGGLEAGDLITSINGNPVKQMDDMGKVMVKLRAGSKVDFVVLRNEKETAVSVTLGRRRAPDAAKGRADERPTLGPSNPASGANDVGTDSPAPRVAGAPSASGPKLGVRTLPITDETRQRYQLPSSEGAFVASVSLGSPAAKAGIPAGSVITSLDGEKVTAPEDLPGIVKRVGINNEVEVTYWHQGQEVTRKIMLTAGPAAAASPTPTTARPRNTDPRPILGADEDAAPKSTTRDSQRIAELEARVRELEERLERLEAGKREP